MPTRTCSSYAPLPTRYLATRTSITRGVACRRLRGASSVPGTTPDKKGAIDSYRIFFAASPAGFAVCPPPSSPSSFRLQSRQ